MKLKCPWCSEELVIVDGRWPRHGWRERIECEQSGEPYELSVEQLKTVETALEQTMHGDPLLPVVMSLLGRKP